MRSRAFTTLLVFFTLAASSFAQFRATARGAVTGTVHDAMDRPATDARVEVRELNTGQLVGTTYVGGNGMFEVRDLRPGHLEILVQQGLSEVRERIDISGNMVATVWLKLPGQPAPTAGDNAQVSVSQMKVPDKARNELKKAREAAQKNRHEDAQKHLARALEIYPDFAEALTLRGIFKLNLAQNDSAREDLEKAVQADAAYPLAYIALGAVYNALSRFDDALRTLDRASALAPNSWQLYFERGKALIGKADYASAVRNLDKAHELGPQDYALVHLLKAHALLGMKNYPEAMASIQEYLAKSPTDNAQTVQAREVLAKVKAFTAANGQ